MNKTFIYSYNPHSASAKALASALGVKRIKHQGSKFVASGSKCILNWGCSSLPNRVRSGQIVNDPFVVANVSDKLSFFKMAEEQGVVDCVVPFTTDKDQVRTWLSQGKSVIARTILSGHSGAGIVLLEGVDAQIVEAPLYTLYKPKKDEYRIHCYLPHFEAEHNGPQVFDVQRKARDLSNNNPNWKVRNHANGFVYARTDINPPQCVIDASLKVFLASGLDFGAVDTIYNEHENRAYVLEINTAPGLTGTTLDKYTEMFKEMLNGS